MPLAPLRAQNDPQSRRAAIEAIYPVMIRAMEEKNFGRARNICDQAILWEPQNPVHHYNMACIEAQAGGARIPYAWGALDLAVALGFRDADHLQRDPDLAPLHDDPRFADLVRKVAFNASVGEVVSSVKIPDPAAKSESATPDSPVAVPPPPAFVDGLPVGLYFMSRFHPATQSLERGVWFFAPDTTVYQDLEHGFSPEDLKGHTRRRGKAGREGRRLEVTWADGSKSAGELERDGAGFTWDMGIFAPVVPFGDAGELTGVFDATDAVAVPGAPGTQRIEFRTDGTFSAEGLAFPDDDPKSGVAGKRDVAVSQGTWQLRGLSLVLKTADGGVLRGLAFPEDDPRTVLKPDRMYFAGTMYKRRP
jgi:hypothetical protein